VAHEGEASWRARANLEILYVLLYPRETVAEWLDAYPQLLQDNEDAKNPPNPEGLDDAGRARGGAGSGPAGPTGAWPPHPDR
jgi:hypothetical protein